MMAPERNPEQSHLHNIPIAEGLLGPVGRQASAPIHDAKFEVSGVKDCIAAARPVYELLGAKEKLAANYPDRKHDFPPEARQVAYDWLDRWLK
jgi:hypothetical protein